MRNSIILEKLLDKGKTLEAVSFLAGNIYAILFESKDALDSSDIKKQLNIDPFLQANPDIFQNAIQLLRNQHKLKYTRGDKQHMEAVKW